MNKYRGAEMSYPTLKLVILNQKNSNSFSALCLNRNI